MAKVISIQPKYVKQIFQGLKKVEYRRANVNTEKGEKFFVYTTRPVKKVEGYFILKKKIRKDIETLWQETKHLTLGSKESFQNYFKGKKEGTALIIEKAVKFKNSKELKEFNVKKAPQLYANTNKNLNFLK